MTTRYVIYRVQTRISDYDTVYSWAKNTLGEYGWGLTTNRAEQYKSGHFHETPTYVVLIYDNQTIDPKTIGAIEKIKVLAALRWGT